MYNKTLLPLMGGLFLIAVSNLIATTTKPNVILLVSDDQGWMDVGYHGGEISTPNIDQLTKDGMELNRWYSYPICSPTRVSLLTGHMSMRHGVFSPIPGNMTIPHDEQLMSDVFKDAGYMTMTAGKWHLGMTHKRDFPINRGFDHTYGSLRAGPDYWTHGRGEQKDWARDGKTVFESGYMTDLFGNEICRLIRERDTSKPFFTYAAFTAPHTPLQAPQEYIDKYAHIEDESRRIYCAMVEVLDVAIGNILKTVDDEGIRDNTIVMFFSDNGGAAGADNGNFRGRKGTVYEGGTRLPAVIRWPGKIPAGVKSEQPMVVYDLFPTLVEAIGLPTNLNTPFDGESLWDNLQTGKARPRKTDMLIGNSTAYAVHSGEFKLVHSNINKHQTDVTETVELFSIFEDPYEETNLADQYPDVVKKMMARSTQVAEWVREAPQRTNRRGGRGGAGGALGGRGPGGGGRGGPNAQGGAGGNTDAVGGRGGPGGGRGGPGGGRGGPTAAPALDANGNIIHIHESVPGE
ncbi:sulfatase-like hydrolase/transferase [Opitutia bacterium ISCC 51]|nr:sulfatase-like hydrolase/transferase [Opitutae bacterium ISCC 51]QXD29679.1 sulfatase-like hydrolase/transferase [Opitutae bacterium ISCC 52]